MKKERSRQLTYRIGELPQFEGIKLELSNKYRNIFLKLNQEEESIIRKLEDLRYRK